MMRSALLPRLVADPETSRDPRVRAVVDQLRRLEPAPAPSPEFRAELRQQLVSIAARVVGESTESTGDTATGSGQAGAAAVDAGGSPRHRRRRLARPLGIVTACVAVLALLLGGAVWMSRDALPGSSLYGLKRAGESVRLSMTSGDAHRGHEYLALATTRAKEARDLVGRTDAMGSGVSGLLADGLSAHTEALIRSTLQSANDDAVSGMSLLGRQAIDSRSSEPLAIITSWAPGQLHRFAELAGAVGSSSARTEALHSMAVVHSALHRAQALRPRAAHDCAASTSDRLGPLPCRTSRPSPGAATASPSPAPSSPSPATSGSAPATPTQPVPSSNPATPSSGAPAGTRGDTPSARPSTTGPTPSRPGTFSPAPILPTLPKLSLGSSGRHTKSDGGMPLHLGPVEVSTCGAHVKIGPVGIDGGGCPTAN